MLNRTIPGGATRDAAGVWRNANGEELPKEAVAELERLQAEQQAEHDRIEAQRQQQQLVNNPAFAGAVQAIGLLGQQRPAEQAQPAPRRRGSEE